MGKYTFSEMTLFFKDERLVAECFIKLLKLPILLLVGYFTVISGKTQLQCLHKTALCESHGHKALESDLACIYF